MMQKVKLFVEGEADKTFFQQYISKTFDCQLADGYFVITSGWEGIKKNYILNQLRKNTAEGGVNIVLFDSDADCEKRRTELERNRQEKGVCYEVFLVPDNQGSGALEDLLERIINPANQCVMDCWHRYEGDLNNQVVEWKEPPTPTSPAKKSMIYGYLEALLGTSKSQKEMIKERSRNYLNANHWNLESEALHPLKDFLSNYFSELHEQ